jgi:hypothetical protein
MTMTTEEVFRTGDLPLAAYLMMKGMRHMTMEIIEDPATNKEEVEWVFSAGPRFNALLTEFRSGEAEVEPRRYARAIRVARNELHRFLGYMETDKDQYG